MFSLLKYFIVETDSDPHDKAIVRALTSDYQPPTENEIIGRSSSTIFISRFSPKINENHLSKHFEKFGKILKCRVVCDIITGISKCYGFIEFKHRSDAKDAIYEMNNKFIGNSQILVDFECERKLKGWKPRRLGGGFGGKKESGQLRFGGIDRPWQRPFSNQIYCRDTFRKKKQNDIL